MRALSFSRVSPVSAPARALTLALPLGLPLGLSLAGCGDKDAEDSGVGGIDCTEEARSSVTVSLVDACRGGPVAPEAEASVEYAVDGGAPVACESVDGATFVCGYEVDGAFSLTASAIGFDPASASVEVPMTDDGCHVVSQSVEISMSCHDN